MLMDGIKRNSDPLSELILTPYVIKYSCLLFLAKLLNLAVFTWARHFCVRMTIHRIIPFEITRRHIVGFGLQFKGQNCPQLLFNAVKDIC